MARNSRRKNQKKFSKPKSDNFKFDKSKDSNLKLKGCNPIQTYGSKYLMHLAGNLPTAYPIGYPWQMSRDVVSANYQWDTLNITPMVAPGVFTYTYIPTFGVAIDPSSPINQAAAEDFKEVRQRGQISGTQYYDAPDLMKYYLVGDSAFTAFRFISKAYLIYTYWKDVNLYHAKEIISAMHIDYNDFAAHIPDVLFYLNKMKYKLASLKIPKSLLIVERHMFMNSHVFKDVDGDKAQYFHFTPKFLWKYDATVPRLTEVDFSPATPMTWSVLESKADEIYNTIIPDEFFGIAASDIMKGFSPAELWQVDEIQWNDKMEPKYDEEMIFQVHNMDILRYSSVTGMDITQTITSNNDTILYWNPTFTVPDLSCTVKRIIDTELENPSAEDNMIMTRFKWVPNQATMGTFPGGTFTLKTCGTEIIVNAEVTTYNAADMTTKTNPIMTFYSLVFSSGSATDGFPRLSNNSNPSWYSLACLSWLNYAPVCYICEHVPNNSTIWFRSFMHAVHNIYYLEDSVLYNLNEAALYGELGLTKY